MSITEITQNYLEKNVQAIGGQKAFDTLSESIDYAWNNWEDYIIDTYYSGEKPEYANDKFIINFIDNELGNNPEDWEFILNVV
jgi:hypothetical protein